MSDRIDDLTEMTNAAIKESLRQQHENAEIGAKWRTDSSLETWFPLTAELIVQKDEEIAKLRAELSEIQDFARFVVRDEPDVTPRRAMIRQCEELAKLSAELAAIKAAPVVGYLLEWNGPDDVAQYEVTSENPTDVVLYESIRELIARPTK